ncbi:MAG: hypothetical protein LBV69_03340 [Bacteroidales bacterium]|nr:hypothetical protein [Bacteroidales bacterium]
MKTPTNILERNQYINKEDIAFDQIRNYEQLNEFVVSKFKDNRRNYIFLDKIQLITNFHIAIKSWHLQYDSRIQATRPCMPFGKRCIKSFALFRLQRKNWNVATRRN